MSVVKTSGLGVRDFNQTWVSSLTDVIQQVGGDAFKADLLTGDALKAQLAFPGGTPELVRFALEGALHGEMVLTVSPKDAVRLSAILMGDSFDENAPVQVQDDHRGALAELLRQVAGIAGTSLSQKVGAEVRTNFGGTDKPQWRAEFEAGFRFSNPSGATFSLVISLSQELVNSFQGAAEPEPLEYPQARPAPPAKEPGREANIDLLMDVDLDVTLRFGERQLLLRDVLELVPGAVVELDQQIQEPVELLVGRKVVARGEVVVVDGNYGLRVTEIASRLERIESLRG